jgi:hypothetical protein
MILQVSEQVPRGRLVLRGALGPMAEDVSPHVRLRRANSFNPKVSLWSSWMGFCLVGSGECWNSSARFLLPMSKA